MSLRNSPDSRVTAADQRTRAGAILAAVIGCVAAFKGLNESVTPPALPILQEQFQVPNSTISWVITGVLLTGTIATPIVSRLGEVWDKRRALLGVLAIVAVGTLMSALSVSIEMLIVGQLLQGIGLSTVPWPSESSGTRRTKSGRSPQTAFSSGRSSAAPRPAP